MTDAESILLQLTGRALFGAQTEFDAREADWPGVYQEAVQQALVLLVYDALTEEERASLPAPTAVAWERDAFRVMMRNEQLACEQERVLRALEDAGVPGVILKGSSSAACYPNPALRAMGDIDILVKREQYLDAVRVLENSGLQVTEEDAVHHCHMESETAGISVEIHWEPNGISQNGIRQQDSDAWERGMKEYFADAVERRKFVPAGLTSGKTAVWTDEGELSDTEKRTCGESSTRIGEGKTSATENPVRGESSTRVGEDERSVTEKRISVELSKRDREIRTVESDELNGEKTTTGSFAGERAVLESGYIPVLQDDRQAVVLLLHKMKHFLAGGLGLRQLCDWAVFVREKMTPQLLAELEPVLKQCGLWRFAGMMTRVCVEALALPEASAPWAMDFDGALAEKIRDQILMEGNFGRKTENYGEFLFTELSASNRLTSCIRVMNDRCGRRWPVFRKFPVLLPVGYVMLIGRQLNLRRKKERPKMNIAANFRTAEYDRKLYLALRLLEPET